MLDMLPTTPKVSNFWLRQRWQRCNQMWRERCGFHEIHGNPSLVSWCVEGCGIVGDDVESVVSLIVYYSCNYQKSCAVSRLFVFVLKEPTLHPWNFTWFNTSSEKMHHRWSVYSSSSAFSCKEADRLRASHNRLPCDPSLARARNETSPRNCAPFFFGQRREIQATQWISMQYNNRQFESFRSLCLRQQCLFSNSPLATCRFTPTPPFSYHQLSSAAGHDGCKTSSSEAVWGSSIEYWRSAAVCSVPKEVKRQRGSTDGFREHCKKCKDYTAWAIFWNTCPVNVTLTSRSRTTSDSTVTACDNRTYMILCSWYYDVSSPWFTSLSTSDISTLLYISCSSCFYVCYIIYECLIQSHVLSERTPRPCHRRVVRSHDRNQSSWACDRM